MTAGEVNLRARKRSKVRLPALVMLETWLQEIGVRLPHLRNFFDKLS